MRTRFILLLALAFSMTACKKETDRVKVEAPQRRQPGALTLHEAQLWFENQKRSQGNQASSKGFNLNSLPLNWEKAESVTHSNANFWVLHLPGGPTVNGVKYGYRKLALIRDSVGCINAKILEIIPDPLYVKMAGEPSMKNFAGKVFIYDKDYILQQGFVMAGGKVKGNIVPITKLKKTSQIPTIKQLQVTETCTRNEGAYYDSEGVLTLYSLKECSYSIYDDGFNYVSDNNGAFGGWPEPPTGGDYLGGGGGGGGEPSSSPESPPPPPLPGEDKPAINPKEMMDCFANVPNAGATLRVTVYVQHPFPGTTFNLGANSVGHTAIGLIKTNGDVSVNQVVGFYPSGSGKDRRSGPSKMVSNGSLSKNYRSCF